MLHAQDYRRCIYIPSVCVVCRLLFLSPHPPPSFPTSLSLSLFDTHTHTHTHTHTLHSLSHAHSFCLTFSLSLFHKLNLHPPPSLTHAHSLPPLSISVGGVPWMQKFTPPFPPPSLRITLRYHRFSLQTQSLQQ